MYRTLRFVALPVFLRNVAVKSLLIKWTGFTWCLLNTVAIDWYLYMYSSQEQVESVSQHELKKLVSRMLEYQSGLLMTLLVKVDPEQGYYPEPSPSTKPNWCKCANCREMSAKRERKCCGSIKLKVCFLVKIEIVIYFTWNLSFVLRVVANLSFFSKL